MVDRRNTPVEDLKAIFHLTIPMRGQCATDKIQRNDYHHGNYGPSLRDFFVGVFDFHARDASECQKSFSEKCLKGP